jgi:hypothetical protein
MVPFEGIAGHDRARELQAVQWVIGHDAWCDGAKSLAGAFGDV